VRAAACISVLLTRASCGLAGLTSRAMVLALGTCSCSSSSRFDATSVFNDVMPVTLPPGRLKLATRPCATGSRLVLKTMGIVVVAALAASAAAISGAVITATFRWTRSTARADNRS